jgi:hypothetical protein
VAKIKRGYDEFHRLWPLQLEFMEQHEQLAPSVFRTMFSDGSEIITNYGSAAYPYKSALVGPMDYSLIRRPQAKRQTGQHRQKVGWERGGSEGRL